MKKQAYFYLTAIVIVLIIATGIFVAQNINLAPYKHSLDREGVIFASNSLEPGEMLSKLRDFDSFTVAPYFVERGQQNQQMTEALVLFSTVLPAKEKQVINVGRIYKDGELQECQTNLGDVLTNKVITAEECTQLLSDSLSARIFINAPDSSLEKPVVLLEDGVVRITPNARDNIRYSTFVFLKGLYPDTEEVIAQVNSVLGNNLG